MICTFTQRKPPSSYSLLTRFKKAPLQSAETAWEDKARIYKDNRSLSIFEEYTFSRKSSFGCFGSSAENYF